MNLGIDPRHADQMVRGLLVLPNGTGKTLRVACVRPRPEGGRGARRLGPMWSAPMTWRPRCRKATSSFDRCIATPDMMALVGRLGKILGPRVA